MISTKPADWSPPQSVDCKICNAKASRSFGCAIGVQNNSDETKHIGKSTSGASNFQFLGKGFPDVDRRLSEEQKEIEALMDEPPTREEIAAGNQQMEELEQAAGKPKGAISGEREMEDVELVGVSSEEAKRIAADEAQRLDGEVDQTLINASDEGFRPTKEPRRVSIGEDDIEAAKQYRLEQPLAEGQKLIKKAAVRRGKDKLREEMKTNRANRK
jgi:hypothetical protein